MAKEFDGQLGCLGENIEKYITFSVPISKEVYHGKTITYKLKFIDSFRFMSSTLSSLANNLSESYQENVKDARTNKKLNQYSIFLGVKIIN